MYYYYTYNFAAKNDLQRPFLRNKSYEKLPDAFLHAP